MRSLKDVDLLSSRLVNLVDYPVAWLVRLVSFVVKKLMKVSANWQT
jgi:hypothetical protein